MTINSSKLREIPTDSNPTDLALLNHSRFKARAVRVVKEAREAKASSNPIRSKGTYSLTTMMSWVTHLVCMCPCSTMIAATAKGETTTAKIMKEMMAITIITIPDKGHSIASLATNVLQRIQTRAPVVIMVL